MRHELDRYSTPDWLVEPILDRLTCYPTRTVLEPACGDGAIVRILQRRFPQAEIMATDIALGEQFDFLTMEPEPRFDLIITNPPFSLAIEFVQRAMHWRRSESSRVVMLLRLAFLATQGRAAWVRKHTPATYVSPRRPSFVHNRTNDHEEYAWFIWGPEPPLVHILKTELSDPTLELFPEFSRQ